MKIRPETAADIAGIFAINAAAFPAEQEAQLVNKLRQSAADFLSLLAEIDNQLVGHILFTPVSSETNPELKIMGLAPMAVMPGYQNQGIGSALVQEGLNECRRLGYQAAVVLGHPDYYPRFGFRPSLEFNLHSEYEVPAEVFMAMELVPGSLASAFGKVKYHPAFAEIA